MVKEIPLGRSALVTIVDDDDYQWLMQWKWRKSTSGYVIRTEGPHSNLKYISIHRLINKTPEGFQTDHINGNKLDNRKANLRSCTSVQNKWNTGSEIGSSSLYKGVSKIKNSKKWLASIKHNNKIIKLGSFYSEEIAALAYNDAAIKLFGDFARLNVIKTSKELMG